MEVKPIETKLRINYRYKYAWFPLYLSNTIADLSIVNKVSFRFCQVKSKMNDCYDEPDLSVAGA